MMRTLKMKLILYVLKEIHSSVTLLSISSIFFHQHNMNLFRKKETKSDYVIESDDEDKGEKCSNVGLTMIRFIFFLLLLFL